MLVQNSKGEYIMQRKFVNKLLLKHQQYGGYMKKEKIIDLIIVLGQIIYRLLNIFSK
jgi:hypothetical protein